MKTAALALRARNGVETQALDFAMYATPGSLKRSQCEDCAAGKFPESEDASSCKLCPAGKFQVNDKTLSVACDVGKFDSDHASLHTKACAVGKFQNSTGGTSCLPCVSCAPGSRRSGCQNGRNNGICIGCAVGQFHHALGGDTCLQCPTGKFRMRHSRLRALSVAVARLARKVWGRQCGFCTVCSPDSS